jgi:hypothetical protein
VSKVEQKEVRLEVGLPPTGFPRSMYFNRFHFEREEGFLMVQFGLVSGSGLLDSYSCAFSRDMVEQNKESLLGYLNQVGRPAESAPSPWKGIGVEKETQVADIVTMAFRGETAETCLFFFSLSAASRVKKGATATDTITAQPLALLRSTADMQKQFIIGLYEEE